MPRRPLIVAGAGRLGTVLGGWFASAGIPVVAVASRSRPHARRAGQRAQAAAAWRWGDLLQRLPTLAPPILVLAIPDDALAAAANLLAAARKDWHGAIVVHTSGALPAAVLRPLQRRGAAIGSLHPIMTFPPPNAAANAPSPAGVVFSLEGDPAAVKLLRVWIRRWRGRELKLSAAAKTTLHAAATLLGPGAVVLMATAERRLRAAGLRGAQLATARAGLVALLQTTAANLAASPTEAAFTGPWARGDVGTVQRHQHQWTRSADRRLHAALTRAAAQALPGKH